MLTAILTISFLGFGALYPLAGWLVRDAKVAKNFYRFNLTLTLLSASAGTYLLWPMAPSAVRYLSGAWSLGLVAVTVAAWQRPNVSNLLLSILALCGFLVFAYAVTAIGAGATLSVAITALGTAVVVMTIFSTTLGHWYLDEGYIPLKYFYRVVYVLWAILALRLVGDGVLVTVDSVDYLGEPLPLTAFLGHVEGVFLIIGLLLGTVFPFISMVFVKKTLDVRSNTSATGLLYVVLIGVLMGDLSYKYYLVKHGLAL